MKIIENPNPREQMFLKCDSCGCKFEYDYNDIKTRTYNNGIIGPGFSAGYHRWINCPNCGKVIDLK